MAPIRRSIAVSAGPIPARLDSVKFVTNRFQGGLAMETARRLAEEPKYDVTLVVWAYAKVPTDLAAKFQNVVRVRDVFEYYDWYVAHAKDFDAFVMAAAVANLTPVKPFVGKFPSHLYKPGDEFAIKFMIAPRAIDAIKALNPKACLIGYKLFDAPDDEALAQVARHTLADSKANIIFANTPATAKDRKLALTQDGSVIPCSFDEHCEMISRAIRQHYYATRVEPMTDDEIADPAIREALATVDCFEKTFDGYGTVAVAVDGMPGAFATTSRGHKAGSVLVRGVDRDARIVHASGKATLNAPAMAAALRAAMDADPSARVVVHRHYRPDGHDLAVPYRAGNYIFPGTEEEATFAQKSVEANGPDAKFHEPFHGYILPRRVLPVDWSKYYEQFPNRYFTRPGGMRQLVRRHVAASDGTLEVGANNHSDAGYAYDPNVPTENAKCLTLEQVESMSFPFAYAFNAINYLDRDLLARILARCGKFVANTFLQAPWQSVRDNEAAILDQKAGIVRHTLRLDGDEVVRHSFHAYGRADYESLGLAVIPYGRNSAFVTKGLTEEEVKCLTGTP